MINKNSIPEKSSKSPSPNDAVAGRVKVRRNRYVFAALFAALIAVSSFLVIPLPGGIPIVLKNLFVVLSGVILGSFYGGLSVFIFLAAGVLGVPVFVIPGGPGAFLTNLGGYLVGYFAGSLAAGLICGIPKVSEKKAGIHLYVRIGAACFAGFAIIELLGAFYMMYLNSMSLKAAMLAGVLPFIPADFLKFVLSVPLAVKLRPIAARYINPNGI